ncbi:MAG: ATP-binding protein [Polyangiaceae bacterium]|nr:ATP-binding protein [Polyangiaceae bacterium]
MRNAPSAGPLEANGGSKPLSVTALAANNRFLPLDNDRGLGELPATTFLEPGVGRVLHDVYTDAVRRGAQEAIVAAGRELLPGLVRFEILTDEGIPWLSAVFGNSVVPVALVGDGIHVLLRLLFELLAAEGGTCLLEEPEIHQHPASLAQTAVAIVEAVRRGTQVIISTHSLDLIDRILATLTPSETTDESFCQLVRVCLDNGELRTRLMAAADAARRRGELEEDLR